APDLRVGDAVSLPLALRGIDRGPARDRAHELLDAAGLGDRAHALPGELSGGERQRVAVCAALAHRPALLLADEPTGELDAASAQAVRALISELTRTHGTTAINVFHDPDTAELADRSVRLRDGRVVEDRRGARGALVVGRGGWVQLPPQMLREAGIGDRARVRLGSEGLIVTSAGDAGGGEPVSSPAVADLRSPANAVPPSEGLWSAAEVKVRGLVRARGGGPGRRRVIEGLSREFAPGRMTAITGRSGSGKTTLLRMLAGIDVPESGSVALDDAELDR